MRKQFKIIIILLIPLLSFSNTIKEGNFSKQKSVKKTYIVNSDAGIDIKNSYGKIYITTWDEDKIELDILIKVSGESEKWVTQRINDITIDINALKNLIVAETNISKLNFNCIGKNNSIEINYNIKIPKMGSVTVNNNYGEIISTDLFANTNLSCDYGKITLAKLNGNSNTIAIDYCNKSSIEYVKNATIKADYSGLSITDFGKINLNADYTDLVFANGNFLKYECNYSKLKLGQIDNLDGHGDYLNIVVAEISNFIKINTDYSKIVVNQLNLKAKSIIIDAEYTLIEMGYPSNYEFDFDVVLKNANFKHDKDLEFNIKQESNSSKNYQGYHIKSNENKIFIRSEYGNLNLYKNKI